MKEGDVVLALIPQFNTPAKVRPAIVLRELPVYRDLLLCGISTQMHQQVQDFDEIIGSNVVDFASSGLVTTSLIRLSFLTVLPRGDMRGTIGAISSDRHKRLLIRLSEYLIEHEKSGS